MSLWLPSMALGMGMLLASCMSNNEGTPASTPATTTTAPGSLSATTVGGTTTTELPKYPVGESGPPGDATNALVARLGCSGIATDYVYYRDEPVPAEAEFCKGPGEDAFTIRVYRSPEETSLAVRLHPEFYCGRAVRVSADNWIVVADSAASAERVVQQLGGTIVTDCA